MAKKKDDEKLFECEKCGKMKPWDDFEEDDWGERLEICKECEAEDDDIDKGEIDEIAEHYESN